MKPLKYSVNIAPFGSLSDPRLVAELAVEAEDAGWDGFFLWDHINWERWGPGMADPWICLAAAAVKTSKIALGTMVTPVFRRRPAKLARETTTLQNLCDGRFILGVGLGAPDPFESSDLGEEGSLKVRARMTGEALSVLRELWTGDPVDFQGEFYSVKSRGFTPIPKVPIPIWVAATWPFKKGPLTRAAGCDGVVLAIYTGRHLTADELKLVKQTVGSLRDEPFDLVYGCYTGKDRNSDSKAVDGYRRAGLTWWMEPLDPWRAPFVELRERIRAGPPAPSVPSGLAQSPGG
jgi:alkanesulfonate monooxygenase SsuD/methylene tetrahydromethanopterin reductase-like flavin-dependent oxidoreductase (luciferase family)